MDNIKFFNNINWDELKKQKRHLLEVINSDSITNEEKQALQGILNILDAMQDHVVDELNYNVQDVFDLKDIVNEIKHDYTIETNNL